MDYGTIIDNTLHPAPRAFMLHGAMVTNPKAEHFAALNEERAKKGLPPIPPRSGRAAFHGRGALRGPDGLDARRRDLAASVRGARIAAATAAHVLEVQAGRRVDASASLAAGQGVAVVAGRRIRPLPRGGGHQRGRAATRAGHRGGQAVARLDGRAGGGGSRRKRNLRKQEQDA